jgi:hypothetical protein
MRRNDSQIRSWWLKVSLSCILQSSARIVSNIVAVLWSGLVWILDRGALKKGLGVHFSWWKIILIIMLMLYLRANWQRSYLRSMNLRLNTLQGYWKFLVSRRRLGVWNHLVRRWFFLNIVINLLNQWRHYLCLRHAYFMRLELVHVVL